MRIFISLIGLFILSACTVNPPPTGTLPATDERLVDVSKIVNAIKCELAETFADNRFERTVGFENSEGKDVVASLTLSDTIVTKDGANIGISIPVGLGLSGSTSITNSGSRSYKLDFNYDLVSDLSVPAFCGNLAEEIIIEGDPFVDILSAIEAEHARIEKGAPTVALQKVAYTSTFSVTKAEAGGFSINFWLIGAGASRTASAKEAQSLKLTFGLKGLPPRVPL